MKPSLSTIAEKMEQEEEEDEDDDEVIQESQSQEVINLEGEEGLQFEYKTMLKNSI